MRRDGRRMENVVTRHQSNNPPRLLYSELHQWFQVAFVKLVRPRATAEGHRCVGAIGGAIKTSV